ncbi:hypothetical protein [Bernardetia sp.]|uniref:hypothetical protein n=1 Tax=Bernardetia sp. TaxID=1937974 RepID=UPI0025C3DA3F|nr:hypothetical protein [Bernardetia sp.]
MSLLRIILTFLFSVISNLLLANGGPIDVSRFKKTGNIRLLQNADIELLKEDLSIKIVNDTTFIEVHYFLKNNGESQQVHYGFPVDLYARGDDYGVPFEVVPYYDFKKYVKYFEPYLSGEKKEIIFWKNEKLYTSNVYSGVSPYREETLKDVPVDRLWYALQLDFEKDSTQELTIKYAVRNRKVGGAGGDMGFVPSTTKRYFVYDLFPSSSWSDGIVKDFSLKLDLSELKNYNCEYEIEGLENLKEEKNGIYSFEQSNFDLKKRSYISVNYDNTRRFVAWYWKSHYGLAGIDSVVSSAPNANYLIDGDPNTVWKGKEGDWIKIFTKKCFEISSVGRRRYILPRGVVFLNGDYSSKEAFDESGKVASMYMKANNAQIKEPNKLLKNDTLYIHQRLLPLPKSDYFLESNDVYEVLQSPTRYSFSYLGMYSKSLAFEYDTFFKVIEIRLVKSTDSNGEISISDLYVLGERRYKH